MLDTSTENELIRLQKLEFEFLRNFIKNNSEPESILVIDLNSEMFSSPIVEKQDNNWWQKISCLWVGVLNIPKKIGVDVVDKFKKYLIKELYFLQGEFDLI